MDRNNKGDVSTGLAVGLVIFILAILTVAIAQGVRANRTLANQARNQAALATNQSMANTKILSGLDTQGDKLLKGIRNLLDRPIVSVKTIRKVVQRRGVRTVVVTRIVFRERVVFRTVFRTRTIIVCHLPNGKPCPH